MWATLAVALLWGVSGQIVNLARWREPLLTFALHDELSLSLLQAEVVLND